MRNQTKRQIGIVLHEMERVLSSKILTLAIWVRLLKWYIWSAILLWKLDLLNLTYCRGDAEARVSTLPMDLLQLVLSSSWWRASWMFIFISSQSLLIMSIHLLLYLGICCLASLRHDQSNGDDVGMPESLLGTKFQFKSRGESTQPCRRPTI